MMVLAQGMHLDEGCGDVVDILCWSQTQRRRQCQCQYRVALTMSWSGILSALPTTAMLSEVKYSLRGVAVADEVMLW